MIVSTTKPFKDNNNNVLSDNQFASSALNVLEQNMKANNRPSSVNIRFIEWLKEFKTATDNGVDPVAYKQSSIQKTMDYDTLIENTEKIRSKNNGNNINR